MLYFFYYYFSIGHLPMSFLQLYSKVRAVHIANIANIHKIKSTLQCTINIGQLKVPNTAIISHVCFISAFIRVLPTLIFSRVISSFRSLSNRRRIQMKKFYILMSISIVIFTWFYTFLYVYKYFIAGWIWTPANVPTGLMPPP